MRTVTLNCSSSAGGNSHSAIFEPDRNRDPFNIGFGVKITTTARYTVQHTFDDVQNTTNPTWFSHEFVEATAGASDGNYAFPCAGIRLEVSADNGGGSVTGTFIQAG